MGHHSFGERFGDYTVVRPLGEGGFASVYLGQKVRKETPAAIKLPKEQQLHVFINELRRTILLPHPNIVEILDFGIRTPDNTAFIIMEYAPNGSFREKYPRGSRVPLDVVVTAVKQVASALQYAHDQRVIHRDVKPENLLLNSQNRVLLSDFGIATASRTATASNTEQGNIIGTKAYMSPEQLKGRPVPASDQYSLAIMVYEWLCGELPFEAWEFYQWLYLHEKEPPPPLRDVVPSLSSAVEQVVLKALAKRPEERFDRIETFALALERAARGEDAPSVISAAGPTKPSTQFDSSPDLARTPFNSIEQLFQEGVRAQSSGNTEEAFRIWREMMTTAGVAEQYSTTARNRIRELRIQMIPLRLKQAREASMQGRWQDEIRLWEDLMALEPTAQDLASLLKIPLTLGMHTTYSSNNFNSLQSIQERLRIAQQNAQSAWIYTGAQQFMHNKDYASARTQLQMLWHDAPYYGDPSGLAPDLGLPAAMNYEQSITAEQVRYEQAIVAERVRYEQERVEQERQNRARKEQERLAQLKQDQTIAKQKRNKRMLILIMGAVVILGIAGGIVGAGGGGVIAGIIAGVAERVGVVLGGGLVEGGANGGIAIAIIGGVIAGIVIGIVMGIPTGVAEVVGVLLERLVVGPVLAGLVGGIAGGVASAVVYGIVYGVVEVIEEIRGGGSV